MGEGLRAMGIAPRLNEAPDHFAQSLAVSLNSFIKCFVQVPCFKGNLKLRPQFSQ
jgi:hypothetical protein